MRTYRLYVLKLSVTRERVPSDALAWQAEVLAASRFDAVCRCREALDALKAQARAAGYRRLSVFCGTRDPLGRANRLDPITLIV